MKEKENDLFFASDERVLQGVVFAWGVGLLLDSLHRFLPLVRFQPFHPVWSWLVGVVACFLGWRLAKHWVSGAAAFVRQLTLLFSLCSFGPVVLFLGHRSGRWIVAWGLLLLVGFCGFLLAPEFSLLKCWLMRRWVAFSSTEPNQIEPQGSARSWLLSGGKVGSTISLLFFFKPYTGRLAAHCLLAACLVLWGLPLLAECRPKAKLMGGLVSVGFLVVCWGFFLTPLPQLLSGNEIIYTDDVDGISVTLHARKSEEQIIYTLTTKRSIVFNTITAYRRAEMLVHPAMGLAPQKPRRILLLGSEDGAMLRELDRYTHPKTIIWIPLFASWRRFFAQAPLLYHSSEHSRNSIVKEWPLLPEFSANGLRLIREDTAQKFDLVIADFPEVTASSKELFTLQSFGELKRMLQPNGLLAISLASVYTQRARFWCMVGLWARLGMHVVPYQLSPSLYFDAGFALVSRHPLKPFARALQLPAGTRYLFSHQPFSVLARFSKQGAPDRRDFQAQCAP